MPYTPADIYANVRPMMNDSAAALWSNTRLREHLIKAYSDLVTEVMAVGVPMTDEVSALINVPLSAVPTTITYPTNLIVPIQLFEKTEGATIDNYVPMTRCAFLPDRLPDVRLLDWAWVDQEIQICGASQDNDVKINYVKDLSVLPIDGDPIPIIGGQAYLEYRTAALACVRGQNFQTAEIYGLEAKSEIAKVLGINVRNLQAVPVRKQPYRGIRNQWR